MSMSVATAPERVRHRGRGVARSWWVACVAWRGRQSLRGFMAHPTHDWDLVEAP